MQPLANFSRISPFPISFEGKNRSPLVLCLLGRVLPILLCIVCIGFPTSAEQCPKVVCAARADAPPTINGVLDDPCWGKCDPADDFLPLGAVPREQTVMRFAFDDRSLYVGVECVWKDMRLLKETVSQIRGKPGFAEGFVDIYDFTNQSSVELFLDPGATMRNHYQLLFNAAGQICGQYKGDWDPFSSRPTFKARVTDNGWTGEVCFPDQGIRKGISHDRSVTTEDENGREFFLTAKPPRPQRAFAFFASLRFIFGGNSVRGASRVGQRHQTVLTPGESRCGEEVVHQRLPEDQTPHSDHCYFGA